MKTVSVTSARSSEPLSSSHNVATNSVTCSTSSFSSSPSTLSFGPIPSSSSSTGKSHHDILPALRGNQQESEVSAFVARSMRDVLEDLHTYYTRPLMAERTLIGGTQLWRPLEDERRRLQEELHDVIVSGHIDRLTAVKYRIYCEELCDLTRVAADAEVSARIRYQYAGCIQEDQGIRLVTDPEEAFEVLSDSDDEDENEDDDLLHPLGSAVDKVAHDEVHAIGTGSSAGNMQTAPAMKGSSLAVGLNKKKEEYRKKKEEEQRMFASCQVRDERGHLVPTLGPFSVPSLADRSMKPDVEIRSRRSLKKKAAQESSSSSDEDLDATSESLQNVSSSTSMNPGTTEWYHIFRSVPLDTQRKLLEALKLPRSTKIPSDQDLPSILAKAIFRLGLEKCIHAMEKQRLLETMLQKKWARQQLIDQLEEDFSGTIDASPELRRNAGIALGLSTTTTQDIQERTIVQGLQAFLRMIRLRLLKKVYTDVFAAVHAHDSGNCPNSNSSNNKKVDRAEGNKDEPSVEKQIEYIVWKVFPRERARLQLERVTQKHKNRGISYVFETSGVRIVHNTGKVLFRLLHVSTLRRNTQRHYSPEFEYGGHRWSLLTMQSKDQLALYLCQTGTVHCKFILTLLNLEECESIRNEGSQRFHKTSAENDWGFNNIVQLDRLLDPQAGFWDTATDSIRVDISLMIITDEAHTLAMHARSVQQQSTENAKTTTAQQQYVHGSHHSSHQHGQQPQLQQTTRGIDVINHNVANKRIMFPATSVSAITEGPTSTTASPMTPNPGIQALSAQSLYDQTVCSSAPGAAPCTTAVSTPHTQIPTTGSHANNINSLSQHNGLHNPNIKSEFISLPPHDDAAEHIRQQHQEQLEKELTTQRALNELLEEERIAHENEWRRKMAKTLKVERLKMHKNEEKDRKGIEKLEGVAFEEMIVPHADEIAKIKLRETRRKNVYNTPVKTLDHPLGCGAMEPGNFPHSVKPFLHEAAQSGSDAQTREAGGIVSQTRQPMTVQSTSTMSDSVSGNEMVNGTPHPGSTTSTVSALTTSLVSMEEEMLTVESFQQNIAQLKEDYASSTIQFNVLQTQRMQLENEVSRTKSEETAQRARLRQAKQKLAALRKSLEVTREKYRTLQQERQSEEAEYEAAESAVAAAATVLSTSSGDQSDSHIAKELTGVSSNSQLYRSAHAEGSSISGPSWAAQHPLFSGFTGGARLASFDSSLPSYAASDDAGCSNLTNISTIYSSDGYTTSTRVQDSDYNERFRSEFPMQDRNMKRHSPQSFDRNLPITSSEAEPPANYHNFALHNAPHQRLPAYYQSLGDVHLSSQSSSNARNPPKATTSYHTMSPTAPAYQPMLGTIAAAAAAAAASSTSRNISQENSGSSMTNTFPLNRPSSGTNHSTQQHYNSNFSSYSTRSSHSGSPYMHSTSNGPSPNIYSNSNIWN